VQRNALRSFDEQVRTRLRERITDLATLHVQGYGGSVEIDDCVFIGNEATQGGAVDTYCSVGTVTIKNCTFTNNSSYGGGGSAITVLDGNAFTLQNCHLTGNTAHATAGRDDDGGAVKIRLTRLSSIIDCVFGGNSCVNSNGGAISNGAGDLTIRDCTFYANAAVDGGAIYSTSTGWYGNKIEYSTFVNNSASTSAGAIYNAVNVETTLTDDILWGDNAPTGPEIANFGTLTATLFGHRDRDGRDGEHCRRSAVRRW